MGAPEGGSAGAAADSTFLPSPTMPTGGLAAHGLGERCAVDTHSGSLTVTVPLTTSPGRGASAAPLTLTWSSAGGRSAYGLGWSLSVPSVVRGGPYLPTYTDEDAFFLAGADRLVPALAPAGADGSWVPVEHPEQIGGVAHVVRRYRPRTDDGRIRVERCTPVAGGAPFWRTTDADNVVRTFGATPASRVADPSDPTVRVHEWLLDEVRDDRGNVAAYTWKPEDTVAVAAEQGERHRIAPGAPPQPGRYLKSIRYANAVPGDAASGRLLVVLDYGEHGLTPQPEGDWPARGDAFSTCRPGFEVRTWRLLRRVLMFHDFGTDLGDGPLPRLVRTVELEHDADSRLRRIRQRGFRWEGGAYVTATLPPLDLDYTDPVIADRLRDVPSAVAGAAQGMTFVDLDGDGLPGVLSSTPGGWWYERPAGEGEFEVRRAVAELPPTGAAGPSGLGDVDSSGRLSCAADSDGLAGSSVRGTDGRWDRFRPVRSRAAAATAQARLRVDVDGDGRADHLAVGPDAFRWTAARGRDGAGETRTVAAAASPGGPRPPADDPQGGWFSVDLTGDGLADLVHVGPALLEYWPGLGRGRYGGRVTMTGTPRFAEPGRFDARRVRFADVTGTGTADVMYLGEHQVLLWRNRQGTAWSAPEVVPRVPPVGALDDLQVLDLLGAGTPCLVRTSSGPGPRARYLDLAAAGHPHLLTGVTNNLGGRTVIRYETSAQQAVRARREGSPWSWPAASAAVVVGRLEEHDDVAGTRRATRFTYRDLYTDPEERESRGFAYAETTEVSTLDAPGAPIDHPPVRRREWFALGRPGDRLAGTWSGDPAAITLDPHDVLAVADGREHAQALRAIAGRAVRTETWVDAEGPAVPVLVTQTRLRVRRLQPADGQTPASFRVEPLEVLESHHERVADDPRVTHELTLAVDAHGAPTSQVRLAYPRRTPEVPEQAVVLAGWTRTVTADVDTPGAYRVSVPTDVRQDALFGLAVPPSGRFEPTALAAQLAGVPEIDLAAPPTPGVVQRRLHSRTRYEFWDDALAAGLAAGQIGSRALVRRVLRLALTDGFVQDVLSAVATPALLAGDGGYEHADGAWWATDGVRTYDPAAFFQPLAHTTPFGNSADVAYDAHKLRVVGVRSSTTAPLSLVATGFVHDYAALAARSATDPNGVVRSVAFDPLGRVSAAWRTAPDGTGDPAALPGVVFTYGSEDWYNGAGPAWAQTATRAVHADAAGAWQIQRVFVDGTGRVALTKTAVEPGEAWEDDGAGGVVLVDTTPAPRWVGTGRTVFDGAGRPLVQYEPYFATGPSYDTAPALVKHAELQVRTHDALGRLVRVDHPDGTLETVEIGPWRQVDADRNDTVAASRWFAERAAGGPASAAEKRAAALAAAHGGTPLVRVCDGLGRFVRIRVDNGPEGVHETRFTLDPAGETTSVLDPRGIEAGSQVRDAAGRIVRTSSPDAGTQLALPDAAGRHLRFLGADGRVVSVAYDPLGRPAVTRVRESASGSDVVAELVVYGEAHPQAAARGLIGQAHRRYDGAGVAVAERYDLAGNVVEGVRRVLAGTAAPDWSALVGAPIQQLDGLGAALLDPEEFPARSEFDALGRPLVQVLPDATRVLLTYRGAGPLHSVAVQHGGVGPAETLVTGADHDARRRRTRVAYGNGVVSTQEFTSGSGRVGRISARAGAATVQDLTYTWDPAGNVVEVADAVAPTVFFAGAVVAPGARYTYDPAYRLRTATGREHASLGVQPDRAEPFLRPLPHPNESGALRPYTETYTYDDGGNLLSLAHASTAQSWTRRYAYAPGTDRLAAHQVPGDPDAGPYSATFDHDDAGRMTRTPHLAALEWDQAGRLGHVDLGGGGTITMQYDGAGRRVRQVWEHDAVREERLYVGSYELYRRFVSGTLELERRTVRVEDGRYAVALVERLTIDTANAAPDLAPRVRYQLADLLGSSVVECDDAGAVISYEEFHPYGTTALWLARGQAASSVKRYRYAGKEKDTETGFYLIGARYYAPWLGRWTSPDPAGLAGGTNRYAYCSGNPVSRVDPTGLGDGPPSGWQMWFSEARAFWIDARATQAGRGFLESTATKVGHRDYLQALTDLWGGPEEWDIGHKESPFGVQKPGTVSKVGVEDAGYNRSKGASADKIEKAQAKAAGQMVRDAEGRWPEQVQVKGKPPAVPQEIGGVRVQPPGTGTPAPPAPPAPATATPKPPSKFVPAGPPGEQLKLPGVRTEYQPNLFDRPARPTVPPPAVAPAAPATPPAQQLDLFKDPVRPAPPAAAADVAKGADVVKGAEVTKDATVAADAAKDASTALDVSADTARAADVTTDAAKVGDVSADAAKVAEVAKDAGAAREAAPGVRTVSALTKSATPVTKATAPVVTKAGLLTRAVEGTVAVGSKVTKVVAPVVKAAAPAVKVVGEVAKPLAVGVAAYDLAAANNNSDRLVAAGDLTAGVAMYCGPVGEAFAVGYTAGGLADKGIAWASKSTVGVDLSPSNGISHVLDAQDKLVSAVIPDDPNKPAYKNENKLAWFLIDTLGF